MNARDELGKLLFTLPVSDRAADTAPEIMRLCDEAAEVLIEKGYSKPRQVSTVEELDALPFESVVRDADGHVLERWGGPDESIWGTVMVKNFIPREQIALPASVLYEPLPRYDAPTETGNKR